jgi:Raf kinase inhibitor-like YbhB/YbcL family protein
MTGCPSDDGGGNETGTNTDGTSTGTPSTSSPSTTASTSSPSTTDDPTSSSSESGSSTEPTTTGNTDTDTDATSSGSSSSGGGEFIVTSPQFEQDGIIPSEHHSEGDNTMPQLDWTGAPGNAQSFAVLFRDLDFMMGFRHSAIWNISADAMGTPFDPEHVAMPPDPAGSVQCRNWFGEFGYGGPGSESNTYEFEVYALDVPDLSAEIDENSTLIEVEAAFDAHVIESATISGQTEGPP